MTGITAIEQIRRIDAQLLVAGERLARYRANEQDVSVIVLRGVIDRQLDERLTFMGARDKTAAT